MNKETLHEYIAKTQTNIAQISVYKDNKLIYLDNFNNYKTNDSVHVMSITKSIVSILIGIAINQGKIKSIDDKVLDYFPEYPVKRGEKTIYDVTIRHLMSMRAPYKGKGDPWTKVCISPNWTYTSLDFLGGKKGLTDEFRYTTVCLHILTGLLYQATKMKTVDYANKYLFEPLDIQKHSNFYAKNAEEHKAFTLSKLPHPPIWFADPTDIGTPGYGLCISADELAKIGLMCLNNGKYHDKQIVTATWLKQITKPRIVEGTYFQGMKYGLLWWIIDKNIYAAIGNSGNVLYIDTKQKLVIGLTATFKPTVFDRIDFIKNDLIPKLLK